jgi:hypothetical protein
MPSTFSPALRIELIGSGEQSGVWGNTTNNNLGDLVEQAITGATDLNVTAADVTLTALNGVTDQARSAVLIVTGTAGVTRVITIPNANKAYTVKNRSDATVQIKTASGTAFDVPTLSEAYVYCNGLNVITGRVITDGANAITSLASPFNSPAFTGTPTAPTASLGTNTTQIATTAFVQQEITALTVIPAGLISLWSGSIASIPAGWLLCNGASGTPDLRDRFVVGAGSTYIPGNTGGATTATLAVVNLPSHQHGISGSGTTGNNNVGHVHSFNVNSGTQSANHAHTLNINTNTAGAHSHTYTRPDYTEDLGTAGGSSVATGSTVTDTSSHAGHVHNVSGTTADNNANHFHNVAGDTGGNSADHNHTFSFTGTSDATGSGTAFGILPPYYALAYIMKT